MKGHRASAVRALIAIGVAVGVLACAGPAAATHNADPMTAETLDLAAGGIYLQHSTDATSGLYAGEPMGPAPSALTCLDPGDTFGHGIVNTVWYALQGTGTMLSANTRAATDFDSLFAVYTGVTPSDQNVANCNNDRIPSQDSTSEMRWFAQAGTTYLLQVGGCDQPAGGEPCTSLPKFGNFGLAVSKPPPNDPRNSPTELVAGQPQQNLSTAGAVEEAGEPLACGTVQYGKTLWFRFTAPAAGSVTFDAASDFDGVLSVYAAGSNTPLGCSNRLSAEQPGASRVRVASLAAGQVLDVQVGGVGAAVAAAEGRTTLTATFDENFDVDGDGHRKPPSGQDCDDADPGRFPGNREIANNGKDDDCDGRALVVTAGAASPLGTDARVRLATERRGDGKPGVSVRVLEVRAPVGATVRVKCKPSCGKIRRTLERRGTLRYLRSRQFARGAQIEIWISHPRRIGKYYKYSVAERRAIRRVRCLPPGGGKPRLRCV